jgi:hypothetical protein
MNFEEKCGQDCPRSQGFLSSLRSLCSLWLKIFYSSQTTRKPTSKTGCQGQ